MSGRVYGIGSFFRLGCLIAVASSGCESELSYEERVELCAKLVDMDCRWVASCNVDFFREVYGSLEACMRILGTGCPARMVLPGMATTPHSLSVCYAALDPANCEAELPTECDYYPGTLPEGSTCIVSEQCQRGAFCSGADGWPLEGSERCGSCQYIGYDVPLGGECLGNSSCELGLYCAEGRCAPRLQLGEACEPSSESCSGWHAQCVEGRCKGPELVPVGETCGQGAGGWIGCVGGRCDIPSDSDVGHCVPWTSEGGSCGYTGDCELFLVCYEGVCTVPEQDLCGG